MSPESVVVVEPIWTGHRPTYLRHYVESFVKKGYHVTVLCPDGSALDVKSSLWETGRITVIPFVLRRKAYRWFPTTFNKIHNWRQLCRLLRDQAVPSGLVFLMSLDTFNPAFPGTLQVGRVRLDRLANAALAVYLRGWVHFPWSGIYLSATNVEAPILRSRYNVSIGILERDFGFAQKSLNTKLVRVPDVTDVAIRHERAIIEQVIIERAHGRRIVSLLGRIHKRKGVIPFLDAAERLRKDKYFFVLAGEPVLESFSEDDRARLRRMLEEPPENCFLHFERLTDGHEFNSLVRATDILYASYLNFPHSSNLLTKAAYFEKPVIVSDRIYMGNVVEAYRMGTTVPEGDVDAIVAAIRELDGGFDGSGARFSEYYERNSVERIDTVISELMERARHARNERRRIGWRRRRV